MPPPHHQGNGCVLSGTGRDGFLCGLHHHQQPTMLLYCLVPMFFSKIIIWIACVQSVSANGHADSEGRKPNYTLSKGSPAFWVALLLLCLIGSDCMPLPLLVLQGATGPTTKVPILLPSLAHQVQCINVIITFSVTVPIKAFAHQSLS